MSWTDILGILLALSIAVNAILIRNNVKRKRVYLGLLYVTKTVDGTSLYLQLNDQPERLEEANGGEGLIQIKIHSEVKPDR